jgi:hypothetical protein
MGYKNKLPFLFRVRCSFAKMFRRFQHLQQKHDVKKIANKINTTLSCKSDNKYIEMGTDSLYVKHLFACNHSLTSSVDNERTQTHVRGKM